MRSLLLIIFRPAAVWAELRGGAPPVRVALLQRAAPLAILPALSWTVGRAAAPDPAMAAGPALAAGFVAIAALGFLWVLLAAVWIQLLAPFFGARRSWRRAVAVAVYSSTPTQLAGALLVAPILAIVYLPALIHSAALCNSGLAQVMGSRAEDCPAYVATVGSLTFAGSLLLGALCGAAGWI